MVLDTGINNGVLIQRVWAKGSWQRMLTDVVCTEDQESLRAASCSVRRTWDTLYYSRFMLLFWSGLGPNCTGIISPQRLVAS